MIPRLRDNLADVRERMARACARAGRAPDAVRLVAVTKSVDTPTARALSDLGAGELGESRAQVLARRRTEWPAGVRAPRWHFLGHLQRNKARAVVRDVDEIHSLDSLRLCEALADAARAEARTPAVWIELDLVGADARTGLTPKALPELVERAGAAPELRLQGLMTLAPVPRGDERDAARARAVFEELAALAADLDPAPFEGGRARLSMGMSSDFEAAIEAGSDLVRVGSALFEGLAPTAGGRA
ncbi:MAG TPA: YggS family pyridoxal phosphate-dependent enzyme [Planctomycetota bacterium]|nr:YggS family pyridoxal phosphate-dependent enzyme [Planctomycetota bacterium]